MVNDAVRFVSITVIVLKWSNMFHSKIRTAAIERAPSQAVPADTVASLAEIRICHTKDGDWLYRLQGGSDVPFVVASPDYQRITAYVEVPEQEKPGGPVMGFLLRTAYECRFCHEGIVSLHAACVEVGDWAVAFTGHSGMGKSTRAQAWVDGLGAAWISGDRPAVRLEAQGATACGVPWDGKEQIFRDVEKPLKCIMEVRRSRANYIRHLTPVQARQVLTQQSFVPMWDTKAAAHAMANVRQLAQKVDVYRVFCGPDPEDAKVIYDILFNHPELIREEADEMKSKKGFVMRDVLDEYIVMPTGDNIATFGGTVVLNEVSAFIYRQLENPVSREDLLTAVLNEYDVDEATAAADLDKLLEQLDSMGLLEK